MSKQKGTPVNFENMVNSFLQSYNIPTKDDLRMVMEKIDSLEGLIRQSMALGPAEAKAREAAPEIPREPEIKTSTTASGTVLNVIKSFKQGADFAKIQGKTQFEDKKLRNIIFRLNKIGKIKRKSRGIYVTM